MALTSKLAMGLSGSGRLGQSLLTAQCPSVEQAAGVVDCTDPCQANSAPCLATTNLTNAVLNLPASTTVMPSGYQAAVTPISAGGSLVTIPTQSSASLASSIIPGIDNTTLAVGAAAVLILLMLMSGGRRR